MQRITWPTYECDGGHPWWEGVVVYDPPNDASVFGAEIWPRLEPEVESLYRRYAGSMPRMPGTSEQADILRGCKVSVEKEYQELAEAGARDLGVWLLEAAAKYLRERANMAVFGVRVLPRLEPKLRGLATRFHRSLGRDPGIGSYDDLLQECRMKVADVYATHGHRLGQHPDGFLYTAARHRLLDLLPPSVVPADGDGEGRSRARVSLDASEGGAPEPADDDDSWMPDLAALDAEVRHARKAIAAALPELICVCEMCICQQRERASTDAERAEADRRSNAMAAFRMRSFEEVSNNEVAEMLGVSAPTATRLYKLGCELVREKIRTRLPREWEIVGPELV